MSLVSLADMKDYLSIDSADTSLDAFLQSQLDLISETIEAYCRRKFAPGTWVETFYKTDMRSSKLVAYHYPIISVTSVIDSQNPSTPITDYRLHKASGQLLKANLEPSWNFEGEIVVTYEAGYAVLPSPIKFAIQSLVASRYNKKKAGVELDFGSDVQSVTIPGTITIAFDYTLENNEPKVMFGSILGNMANIIAPYVSDRAIVQSSKLSYVEAV